MSKIKRTSTFVDLTASMDFAGAEILSDNQIDPTVPAFDHLLQDSKPHFTSYQLLPVDVDRSLLILEGNNSTSPLYRMHVSSRRISAVLKFALVNLISFDKLIIQSSVPNHVKVTML
jgi:hypothetical protein